MTFEYEKLKNWKFEEVTQNYTSRDTILYALGVGLGSDPMDETQLPYVFEEAENFSALPTMAVVLGSPGFWSRDPETGIDWVKILHGEQKLELHNETVLLCCQDSDDPTQEATGKTITGYGNLDITQAEKINGRFSGKNDRNIDIFIG